MSGTKPGASRPAEASFTPGRKRAGPGPRSSAAIVAGSSDAANIDLPSEAPSVELLRYYKKRIEEFEAERELFLTRFQEIQVSHEEMHRVKWELKVREEEIHELQKALSDANVYLYDEREQVLKLQAENDQLKIQELEDRRRIQHLLALTEPVTQEVTFFRDRRPESMSRYPGGGVKPAGQGKAAKTGTAKPGVRGRGGKRAAPGARGPTSRAGSSSTASAARSTRTNATDPNFGRNAFAVREAADHMVDHAAGAGAGAGRVPATAGGVSGGPVPSHRGQRAGTDAPNDSTAQVSEAGSKGGKGSAPNRVLRTVYLPSERADALLMTVQSLQQQLAENKRLMEDRVQTWRRDRKEREEAWRNKANADQLKIAALEKQIASSAEKLHAGTREYLAIRHQNQVESRQLREKAAMLEADHARMQRELKEVQIKAAAEIKEVRKQASAESDHLTSHNRLIARQREDDLAMLKEQYAEVQAMYAARVKALEEKLSALRQKHKALEKRRNMELEGFTIDVANLRRELRNVVAQLMGQAAMSGDAENMELSQLEDGRSVSSRASSRAGGQTKRPFQERGTAGVFGFNSQRTRGGKAKRKGSLGKKAAKRGPGSASRSSRRATPAGGAPEAAQPPPPPPRTPRAQASDAEGLRGSVVPPVYNSGVPAGESDHLRNTIGKLQAELHRLETQLAATAV